MVDRDDWVTLDGDWLRRQTVWSLHAYFLPVTCSWLALRMGPRVAWDYAQRVWNHDDSITRPSRSRQ